MRKTFRARVGGLVVLALSPILLAAGAASSGAADPVAFGAPIGLTEPTRLALVLKTPEEYETRKVLLRGRLADVCQRKGCWTMLQDGDAVVRVRFQDYGFFLPKDSVGRTALVEGTVSVRTLSEREARHYAEEARGGDPDSIRGPQREVGFVATGVRLLGEG